MHDPIECTRQLNVRDSIEHAYVIDIVYTCRTCAATHLTLFLLFTHRPSLPHSHFNSSAQCLARNRIRQCHGRNLGCFRGVPQALGSASRGPQATRWLSGFSNKIPSLDSSFLLSSFSQSPVLADPLFLFVPWLRARQTSPLNRHQ